MWTRATAAPPPDPSSSVAEVTDRQGVADTFLLADGSDRAVVVFSDHGSPVTAPPPPPIVEVPS